MHKYLFRPAQYPVDTQISRVNTRHFWIFNFWINTNTSQNISKLQCGWDLNFFGSSKLYFKASGVQNTIWLIFNNQVKTGCSLSSGLCPHAQADLPTPIAQNECGQPQNEWGNECKCYYYVCYTMVISLCIIIFRLFKPMGIF